MIRNNDNQNQPPCRCSFCGRTDKQVRRLIAGPTGVYICDECTELCEELLAEEYQQMYEEGEEIEKNNCAMSVYLPSKGESIWQIAKTLGMSIESIMQQNADLGDTMKGDERIVIYREL